MLSHRGKLERVASIDQGSVDWLLVACLRLAVVIHRARDLRGTPPITMQREGRGFSVNTPPGWLQKPLLTSRRCRRSSANGLRWGAACMYAHPAYATSPPGGCLSGQLSGRNCVTSRAAI